MKRHIIPAIIALCLCSCSKLDLYPLDTGSNDSWYKTEDQMVMSIRGLYRTVFWPLDNDYWADDHQSRSNLNIITGGTINGESSEVKNRWQNCYKAIARANTILANLDNAQERLGISEEKVRLYRAQTLVARAAQYCILTTYFGDVVYVDKEISIEEAFRMGRTDKSEILEKVYADLETAAADLPVSYTGSVELATRGAALAIKARYALFNGKWQIAADAARRCMDLGVYELYPEFSKLFLASTAHASENILSWPRSVDLDITLDPGNVMGYCTRNRGGYASEYPSWELFCSFLCRDGKPIDESPLFNPHKPFENRDPRCAATIAEFGTEHLGVIYDPNPYSFNVMNNITGKQIKNLDCNSNSMYASFNGLVRKKGVDEDWVNNQTFKVAPDYVFIRYAEVLLIYAEAKIELGQIDASVLNAINSVRARAYGVQLSQTSAYPAVTALGQDEMRRIVRLERRMELAYEGLRYMDLLRWKLAEKALNQPNYGLLDNTGLKKLCDDGNWFFAYVPEIDEDGIADFSRLYEDGLCKIISKRNFDASKNYLWPIPSQEVLTNPFLGQNDNY
ncbi:MAG: RagB/SusD family nutrient uptake outer membrane protein [Rikenellaceae bacterium]|nr:RagB/SusD family nutrient uptake outer membrane protein [Rikenellaceae bacterium]